MTIYKDRLRALAEAATPGRHYDRLDSAGGGIKYECNGDDGSLVLKVDHKNDEFGFVGDNGEADEAFFLACNPATILALLGEIDRLEERNVYWIDQANTISRDRMAIRNERDQLKAENEALRKIINESATACGAAASVECSLEFMAMLPGEIASVVGGLRRDAKRYRFLRNQHWPVAYLAVVVNPKESVKLGHDCPGGERLDEQVDGAMTREASHD